jgi:hypothetical protein
LADAAAVLNDLANGVEPDRAQLVTAALSLDTLAFWGGADRDLLDAAAGLQIIATGGALDLDEAGRFRARQLAAAVRAIAGHREPESLPATNRASHYS